MQYKKEPKHLTSKIVCLSAALAASGAVGLSHFANDVDLASVDNKPVAMNSYKATERFLKKIDRACGNLKSDSNIYKCSKHLSYALAGYTRSLHFGYDKYQETMTGLSYLFGQTGVFGDYGSYSKQAYKTCVEDMVHRTPSLMNRNMMGFSRFEIKATQCRTALQGIERSLNASSDLKNGFDAVMKKAREITRIASSKPMIETASGLKVTTTNCNCTFDLTKP